MKQYRVLLWGRDTSALEIGLNQLSQRDGWELHSIVGAHLILVREVGPSALPELQAPVQRAIEAVKDAAVFDPSKPTKDPQPIPGGDRPNVYEQH